MERSPGEVTAVTLGGFIPAAGRAPVTVALLEQKIPLVSAATYEDVDVLRERDRAPVLVSKKD